MAEGQTKYVRMKTSTGPDGKPCWVPDDSPQDYDWVPRTESDKPAAAQEKERE